MPWRVQDTSVLIEEYGTLENALNKAEEDGWELRFIRPSWNETVGRQRVGADESCVFFKPKDAGSEVW